jgi:hypothetical protein
MYYINFITFSDNKLKNLAECYYLNEDITNKEEVEKLFKEQIENFIDYIEFKKLLTKELKNYLLKYHYSISKDILKKLLKEKIKIGNKSDKRLKLSELLKLDEYVAENI